MQGPSPSILDKYFAKHRPLEEVKAILPQSTNTTSTNFADSSMPHNIITSDIKSRLKHITQTPKTPPSRIATSSTPADYKTKFAAISSTSIPHSAATAAPEPASATPYATMTSPHRSRLSSSSSHTRSTPLPAHHNIVSSSKPCSVTMASPQQRSSYYSTSTSTPQRAAAYNNTAADRSKHMQAELHVKEMEVNKLASLAAETRRERDELRERVNTLKAELENMQASSRMRLTSTQERPRKKGVADNCVDTDTVVKDVFASTDCSSSKSSDVTTDASPSQILHPNIEQQHAMDDLQRKMQLVSMQLAGALDRAVHAETALAEERSRRERHHAEHAEAMSMTETALAAQVKALAAQLQVSKGETTQARQEIQIMKEALRERGIKEKEGKERTYEEMMHLNRELEASLRRAGEDLAACRSQLESAHYTIHRLSAENRALHTAQDSRTAENRAATEAYESQVAELQRELRTVKLRAVQAEDAIARSDIPAMPAVVEESTSTSMMIGSYGPSPLRDLVASLRSQLQDQELRAAAAEEELLAERHRNAELQQRVVDHAMELDDARHQKMEIDALRNELAAARRAAEAAQRRSAALSEELEGATDPGDGEIAALMRALDEKEEEVMKMQGQIRMLNSVTEVDDAALDNWLIA